MLTLLQRRDGTPRNIPPTGANSHSTREDGKLSGTISWPSRATSHSAFVQL